MAVSVVGASVVWASDDGASEDGASVVVVVSEGVVSVASDLVSVVVTGSVVGAVPVVAGSGAVGPVVSGAVAVGVGDGVAVAWPPNVVLSVVPSMVTETVAGRLRGGATTKIANCAD